MFGRSIGETLDVDFYQSVYKGGTATKEELEKALKITPIFTGIRSRSATNSAMNTYPVTCDPSFGWRKNMSWKKYSGA